MFFFSQSSLRRIFTRSVFTLFLSAVILFSGCSPEDEPKDTGIPTGEWSFGDDPYKEGYNITTSSVEYYSPDYGPGFPARKLNGSIERAVDFSNNSGVLIIKITFIDNIAHTLGKYTCVYYKEYTSSHVYLANPSDALYNPIETDSLNNALSLFTSGNMSTHVTFWGTGYTK